MQVAKGLSMEKGLCWGSLGVAGLTLLLFILDITPLHIPFGGLSIFADICGVLAAGVLLYLSWDTLRDFR
jgi:hypothetical protein